MINDVVDLYYNIYNVFACVYKQLWLFGSWPFKGLSQVRVQKLHFSFVRKVLTG